MMPMRELRLHATMASLVPDCVLEAFAPLHKLALTGGVVVQRATLPRHLSFLECREVKMPLLPPIPQLLHLTCVGGHEEDSGELEILDSEDGEDGHGFWERLEIEWSSLWRQSPALRHVHLKGCAQGAFTAASMAPAKLQRLTLENIECLTPQLHLSRGCTVEFIGKRPANVTVVETGG